MQNHSPSASESNSPIEPSTASQTPAETPIIKDEALLAPEEETATIVQETIAKSLSSDAADAVVANSQLETVVEDVPSTQAQADQVAAVIDATVKAGEPVTETTTEAAPAETSTLREADGARDAPEAHVESVAQPAAVEDVVVEEVGPAEIKEEISAATKDEVSSDTATEIKEEVILVATKPEALEETTVEAPAETKQVTTEPTPAVAEPAAPPQAEEIVQAPEPVVEAPVVVEEVAAVQVSYPKSLVL